jgi:hypothetical protein
MSGYFSVEQIKERVINEQKIKEAGNFEIDFTQHESHSLLWGGRGGGYLTSMGANGS